MAPEGGAFDHLETLCNKLELEIRDEDFSENKLVECRFSLMGQIFLNLSLNHQALITAMRKAWRLDNVAMTPMENGVFCFNFHSETDQQRVRILGLPSEWKSEGIVHKIASRIGKVIEVKVEEKGPVAQRVGKAKVELDVAAELIVGQPTSHGNKKIWLDFKYKRLPFYCYSCGKLGHYATSCKTIPYDETNFNTKMASCFGNWLRAEVQDHSPFWDVFYTGNSPEDSFHDSDIVPETQDNPPPTLLLWDVDRVSPCNPKASSGQGNDSLIAMPKGEPIITAPPQRVGKEVLLLPAPPSPAPPPGAHAVPPQKKECKGPKTPSGKKQRQFSPYKQKPTPIDWLDESKLLETPIGTTDDSYDWAMVAGPKMPPRDK
ncbi:hypothetical protein BT93_F0776 [Corymbia citriodora subsp. variegata]|nr:hypothetical protein BT93_F0776 [Corymbia citriodora subsp. variegata]